MTLPKFVGTVKNINYKIIFDEQTKHPKKYYSALELEAFYDLFGENIDQWQYYAEVDVLATKRGGSKPKKSDIWSCLIYLTPDQYSEREIEIGDIIILEHPTLKKVDMRFYIYDPEQLVDMPPRKIKRRYLKNTDCTNPDKTESCRNCKVKNCPDRDRHIQRFACTYASNCRVVSHNYTIMLKAEFVYCANVGGIKITFESPKEMREFAEGEFYLSTDEAVKLNQSLVEAEGKPLTMRFYSRRVKFREAQVECQLSYDDQINTNMVKIKVK